MNPWKVSFFILLFLFVCQTLFLYSAYREGKEMALNEEKCMNICNDYGAYQIIDDTCFCYKDNKIVYEEIIK